MDSTYAGLSSDIKFTKFYYSSKGKKQSQREGRGKFAGPIYEFIQ